MSGPGSRPIDRTLGAIGGGLGALPFLAVARAAATAIFPLPALPGAERLTRDVKQATYFEAAVLLICVPTAAFFFGRILPVALESRGLPPGRASLAGAGFGTSLLLWRAGVSAAVSLIASLALAAAIVGAPLLRRSRLAPAVALLVIFSAGLYAFYRPLGRLDLFEDGVILFGANSLANGARPYLDVYPIHGWGADGGLPAAFFPYTHHDLVVFQFLRAVSSALALACLAAASMLAFRDLLWGAVGFVACLAFCPYPSERHVPAFIALCLFISASRSDSARTWIWAGMVSGVTLFATLDFGIILLSGGALGPIALSILERRPFSTAVAGVRRFGCGFLLGCVPFVGWLAAKGALAEFLRVSFVDIPTTITPVWGLPAGSFAQAVRAGSLFNCFHLSDPQIAASLCFLLLVLVSAIVVLLFRSADRSIEPPDRAALICLLVALLALRGVLGRADVGHQMLYGVFAGLPATWLLWRAWKATSRFRPALCVGIASASFLMLRPDLAVSRVLLSIEDARKNRRLDAIAATPFGGHASAILERQQAKDLHNLRRVIDEVVPAGETFFDFGNEPGLYFLLNRRPPVRYSHVPSYQTAEKQREVIAALDRERPPLAILSSGSPTDTFDSVPNRDRAPLVARFLDAHYRVMGKVGPRTVAVWKGP